MMKTRDDFVSNSSSSSFVLCGKNARKGLKLLRAIAAKCEIPYSVEEEVELHLFAKNKNSARLWKKLEAGDDRSSYAYEGWRAPGEKPDPETTSFDYVEKPMSNYTFEQLDDKTLRLIEDVTFYVSDGYSSSVALKMLYLFFGRNGCAPDASESEQDFLEPSESEKFFAALAKGAEDA